MRYFTFRFLHQRRQTAREFTLAGTHSADCLTAAWGLLADAERPTGYTREDWRLLSTVSRAVTDLADALDR